MKGEDRSMKGEDRSMKGETDTHESDYCGHPFRVSRVFPSTYHQGSAQLIDKI